MPLREIRSLFRSFWIMTAKRVEPMASKSYPTCLSSMQMGRYSITGSRLLSRSTRPEIYFVRQLIDIGRRIVGKVRGELLADLLDCTNEATREITISEMTS